MRTSSVRARASLKRFTIGSILLLPAFLPAWLVAAEPIRHELKVFLQPESRFIQVEDTITLPESLLPASGGKLQFQLHSGLDPASPTADVQILREKKQERPAVKTPGFRRFNVLRTPSDRYTVSLPPGQRSFAIQYGGRIYHPLEHRDDTEGFITPQGIFLTGITQWYPRFDNEILTFTMDVRLPESWIAVSQGERSRHEHEGSAVVTRWESPEPQEEIDLIGNRFTEYSRTTGSIQLMIFLRSPDEALANRYLETGRSYLKMYQDLFGPYPYKKLAVVENFWETGYNFPSLVHLGSSAMRLPATLSTTYPHEILRNWWGNGVFADSDKDDWSEGLTTYLVDHLLQEQNGTAAAYRQTLLQQYADDAAEPKAPLLTEIRSRRNPYPASAGAGRTVMFFHMLRTRLGDEAFINALKKFYRDYPFRRAAFKDLLTVFSAVSGEDLSSDFAQWLSRQDAPELRIGETAVQKDAEGYLLTAQLRQTQPGAAYGLRVPVAVQIEGQEETYQTTVPMADKQAELALRLPAPPLRLVIDPEFDLFRRFDRREITPVLARPFRAEKTLFILPSNIHGPDRTHYRQFIDLWFRSHPGKIEIRLDGETSRIPADRTVWILGWENRFLPEVQTALAGQDVSVTPDALGIGQTEIERKNHSIVLTGRHPGNPKHFLIWLAADPIAALPGLARTLSDYEPYSFLVFEGDQPTNRIKNRWPVLQSPLSVSLKLSDALETPIADLKFSPRRPLAEPPEETR